MTRIGLGPAGALAARFRDVVGHSPETLWSAPGRVNLIGEHTDYNDGFVLPFAIDRRVRVAAARRADDQIVARSLQVPDEVGSARVTELTPRPRSGSWLEYPFGVVWALGRLGHLGGVDLLVDGDVPLGAGVSSSAALECAVAGAVAELYQLELSATELALACRDAENDFVGVPCGVMDQLAALLCTSGHVLFVDTRTLAARQVALDPVAAGCVLLLVDTRVRHTLASSEYAERRSRCETAAGLLGTRALRDITVAELDAAIRALSDPQLARCVRHVVTENARVLDTVASLESGQLRSTGRLLAASHASLRDDFEVSCHELDVAVDAAETGGALGARMIGGGFGGCVLALIEADAEETVRSAIHSAFAERRFKTPEMRRVTPSAGAQPA